VSHHLRRLRDAGLVEYHRHGNQIFYSIEDTHIAAILEEAQHHTEHTHPVSTRRTRSK
jgi:DNA-binding transcriptional ArsR family regulator